MEEWLERQTEIVGESVHGRARSSLPFWKMICRYVLKINRDVAEQLLNGKFKTVTYLELTPDGSDLVERQWLFDKSELE
jgi:hypothetical protein